MKVIIFGIPGSGKGTQSTLLEKNKGFFKLSPGDLLRKELNDNTDLANEIKKCITEGNLVRDDLIFKLISKNILKKNNILFDGYPRNLNQALFLKSINIKIDMIININIKHNDILKRIKYRMLNKNTNLINLLNFNLLKIRYKEDLSGFNFFKRLDDKNNIIMTRILEYEKEINSLIDFYIKNDCKILNLDGSQSIDSIYININNFLNSNEK